MGCDENGGANGKAFPPTCVEDGEGGAMLPKTMLEGGAEAIVAVTVVESKFAAQSADYLI